MERLGLTHRAIRPDNLFFLDEAREILVMGDCVTAPAGFHQPPLLEPIERTMASPARTQVPATARIWERCA